MAMTLARLKLRSKLSLMMLLVGLIPLIGISVVITHMAQLNVQKQVSNQLEALMSTRKTQVENYFKLIENQVLTLSEDQMIVDAMQGFSQAYQSLPYETLEQAEGLSSYQQPVKQYYDEAFKKTYLEQNLDEIDTDVMVPQSAAAVIAQNLYVAKNKYPLGKKNKLNDAGDGSRYSAVHKKYHPIINSYLEKFGFYDIFLVDAKTGDIVYSVFKEVDYARNLYSGFLQETNFSALVKSIKSESKDVAKLVDFKSYLPSYNAPTSFMASPIYNGQELIGVLVFQMPLGEINAMMQRTEGLGETGETYLIGDDLLMRSQSRFTKENTIFKTKVDTQSAKDAFAGQSGVMQMLDYRGTPVLSAFSAINIADLNWAVLAEMDEAEAFQAINEMIVYIIIIIVVTIVIVVLIAMLVSNRIVKPISSASLIAGEISNGNFNNQFEINTQDEIGDLLGALEAMQNKLHAQIAKDSKTTEEMGRIKQALDNVSSNVMVADNDLNIIYMNHAVETLFKNAEADIKTQLPNFNSHQLIGTCIDDFHQNPAHQRGLLKVLNATYESNLIIGPRHMTVIANPVKSDTGERIGTVVEWLDKTNEVKIQQEIESIVNCVKVGNLGNRIETADKIGFFEVLSIGINELTDIIEGAFTDIGRTMQSLSEGDLNDKITSDYDGTYLDCKNDINKTIDKLAEIFGQVTDSAGSINTSSQEIASGNNNLSHRAEQQAANLEETASSMEQLTSTVKNNADNARLADQYSSAARTLAEEGGNIVQSAVDAMQDINQSSSQIAEIIGVIDEIAFQTNLLALNASVEAARAGEQGRGFSVVATEVRNLAQRSATAAKESKDLIQNSVEKVRIGSKYVNEAGQSLSEIVSGVKKVVEIVAEIASASAEQSQGITQVNEAVAQLDEITQQNAALAEQASAASVSMSDQSTSMIGILDFFKTDGQSARPHLEVKQSTSVALPSTSTRKPSRPVNNQSSIEVVSSVDDSDEWEDF